jgi:uncharacterized protein (TIGR00290 family)
LTGVRAIVSWSGGKDSCLALHLAHEQGLAPAALVTMFDEGAVRSRSHALPRDVVAAQARALGLHATMPPTSWPAYESDFVAVLQHAAAGGATHAVFGDIDLAPHREWEEKVCARAGLAAVLPLWHWPRRRVVDEVFARGIDAIVVCVNTRWLPREFCGRRYDRQFVADLPEGVDACGENGEFHTCVVNAPLFAAPVPVGVRGLVPYDAPAQHGGDRFWFAELDLLQADADRP